MLSICVNQAELLTKLRDTRGLSLRNLAISAKVNFVTVSRSEGGHTELQGSTAVRILKALNSHAQFSTEELGQIQDAFGISAGLFVKPSAISPPQTSIDHTPASLAAALTGIVGSARATELIRAVLTREASKLGPALKHVSEETGSDGTPYRVSTVDPAYSKKEKPGASTRRKAR